MTELDREIRARLEQVESDRAERAQAMGEAAQITEKAINDLGESAADGAIIFEPTAEIIVADRAAGGKEAKARLRAVLTQASLDAEEEFTALKESIAKEGEQKRADLKALAEGEIAGLRANAKTSAQSRKEEIAKEKKALIGLKPYQLLPEIGRDDELDSFRTLDAKFGSERPRGARIFRAGMGAEAVRELIERMDLDAEAKALAVEVRVSVDNRIGEEGQGWNVAMATAGFERGLVLRSPARYQRSVQKLVALYRRHRAVFDGIEDENARVDRMCELNVEMQVLFFSNVNAQRDRAMAVMNTVEFVNWCKQNKDLLLASRS